MPMVIFWINTATDTLFGPKSVGTWPAGVSLISPDWARKATPVRQVRPELTAIHRRSILVQARRALEPTPLTTYTSTHRTNDMYRYNGASWDFIITLSAVLGSTSKAFVANKGAVDQTGIAAYPTITKITVQNIVSDPDNLWDETNSKFTAPVAGVIELNCLALTGFTPAAANANATLYVYKNGAQYSGGYSWQVISGTGAQAYITSFFDHAAVGDYYEFYIYFYNITGTGTIYSGGHFQIQGLFIPDVLG